MLFLRKMDVLLTSSAINEIITVFNLQVLHAVDLQYCDKEIDFEAVKSNCDSRISKNLANF